VVDEAELKELNSKLALAQWVHHFVGQLLGLVEYVPEVSELLLAPLVEALEGAHADVKEHVRREILAGHPLLPDQPLELLLASDPQLFLLLFLSPPDPVPLEGVLDSLNLVAQFADDRALASVRSHASIDANGLATLLQLGKLPFKVLLSVSFFVFIRGDLVVRLGGLIGIGEQNTFFRIYIDLAIDLTFNSLNTAVEAACNPLVQLLETVDDGRDNELQDVVHALPDQVHECEDD